MSSIYVLALDVGERRVGVATGNTIARLARPVTTLVRDDTFWQKLEDLVKSESITQFVVGLPRSLEGAETAQTKASRAFAAELKTRLALPVDVQDEALTSRQAEAELKARGKTFAKGDIDALAAVYILEDYLNQAEHVHA